MNAASQIFVAVTDELLYDRPENIESPLVPYSTDVACHHWLDIEINPEEVNAEAA